MGSSSAPNTKHQFATIVASKRSMRRCQLAAYRNTTDCLSVAQFVAPSNPAAARTDGDFRIYLVYLQWLTTRSDEHASIPARRLQFNNSSSIACNFGTGCGCRPVQCETMRCLKTCKCRHPNNWPESGQTRLTCVARIEVFCIARSIDRKCVDRHCGQYEYLNHRTM